jgi:hypothetical protein
VAGRRHIYLKTSNILANRIWLHLVVKKDWKPNKEVGLSLASKSRLASVFMLSKSISSYILDNLEISEVK